MSHCNHLCGVGGKAGPILAPKQSAAPLGPEDECEKFNGGGRPDSQALGPQESRDGLGSYREAVRPEMNLQGRVGFG